MKIISCHIDAFGKINDAEIKFNENLNSLCEENGYGKTTLAKFIKAMFFGFDSSKKFNDRTKYQPLVPANFGGSLVFQTEKGKFKVFRSFKKSATTDEFSLVNLETNLPSKTYTDNLGEEIFGVGKDTFDATIFFGQNELESEVNDSIRGSLIGNLSKDDISALTVALNKIKNKKSEIRAEMKTFDLERDRRTLKENLLHENDLKLKIEKVEGDLKILDEKIGDFSGRSENLKSIKKELDEYKSEIKAIDIFIDDKKQQLSKLKNEIVFQEKNLSDKKLENKKNNEKTQKNAEKMKKNNIFLIFSIVFVALAVVFLGIYFALKENILIYLSGVFCVAFIVFLVFFLKRKVKKVQESGSAIVNFEIEEGKLQNLQKDEIYCESVLKDKEQEKLSLKNNFRRKFGMSESDFSFQYEKIENELKIYENQKLTLKNDLKHFKLEFEKVQNYVIELQDKLEEDIEKDEKLNKNMDLLLKTEDFLKVSSENLSGRYVDPVQKRFDEFYKKFFVKDSIVVDANLNLNIEKNNLNSHYLSAGTLDLVNICKRFALIDLLFKKESPFIILDDPFVNLDDKNLQVAKEIVLSLSKKYQIIFLTCHSARKF